MQRRARTRLAGAALALVVAGGLTACTGVTGDEEADTKPGDASAAAEPAPPGKFRTLPEPCGAVGRDTLEKMLPGAAAEAKEAEEENTDPNPSATPSPLDGEAAPTYDTDRRVGCTWQSTTSLGSRQLTIDFERIVSYDPEISDDEQAEQLFAERAEKAGVGDGSADSGTAEPGTEGPGTADAGSEHETEAGATGDTETGPQPMSGARNGSTEAPAEETTGKPDAGGNADDKAPGNASPTDGRTTLASPSPKPSLPPRSLDDIGDDAFIDDRLKTAADGRGSHRDITLVFRTSNVLVTVEYSQSIADAHRTPDSAELQKYAQNLARQLAEQFSES